LYEAGQQANYDAQGNSNMKICKGLVGGEEAMHISAGIMDVVETQRHNADARNQFIT
jgi:hypothetical protein